MSETNSLIVIDVETTGFDTRRDQVIELAVQFGLAPDSRKSVWRYRPSCRISPRASAVHGISEADVSDCPSIREHLSEISSILEDAQFLVGYNIGFDVEMILAEFERHEAVSPNLETKKIIDPLDLWRKCEPRNLSAAVERFSKRKHVAAHSALGDVEATAEVLLGMVKQFELEDKSLTELADFICPPRKRWVGPSYHVIWEEEAPCFGFGKHKGRSIVEMASAKDDYLNWVLQTDFPPHVKGIVKSAMELSRDEFMIWVKTTYV